MANGSSRGSQPTGDSAKEAGLIGFSWQILVLPAVLFVLLLAQTATVAVNANAISPFDEGAHFDYVVQIQKGNFPLPAGQRYSEEAVQVWACRPVDEAMSLAPLCGEANSATDPRLPFLGVNYVALYGPVYYLMAAGGSSILSNLGVGAFIGARLMSSVLYGLGAALLLLVAQRISFSRVAAWGIILAAASMPLALSMGATITPDSMVFLLTAAVIASALLSRTWRSAVLTTSLVGVVAGLTKPNFLLIALLGSILLLMRWISIVQPTLSWRTVRRFLAVGPALAFPVVLSAAACFGWVVLASSRKTGLPPDGDLHLFLQSSLGPVARAAQQLSFLMRFDAMGAFSGLNTNISAVTTFVVILVVLGACFGAWFWRIDADKRSVIVLRSVALALPLAAVALVVIYWVAYQGSHGTSPRYGLPFLAAASVGFGASVQRRAGILVGLLGLSVWILAWVDIVRAGYI
jgi:hypothetical protein